MKKRAISLFSGAGGMDVGFAAAGFDVVWANDSDKNACETYRENHGNVIHHGRIENYMDELKSLTAIDVVFGGPPCQGFSVAGRMDPDDERSQLIWRFLEVIEITKPRVFVMENVKALGTLSKWSAVRLRFLAKARELGYSVDFAVLNSANFDTPQARERVFFIGAQGVNIQNLQILFEQFKKPGPTVKEALASLSRAGTGNNQRTCNAEITMAANPIMRKSPYAGMLFNGLGRPVRVNGYSATLPASMGGNKTPIIDEAELYENEDSWVEAYHLHLSNGGKPLGFKEAPARLRRLTIDECRLLQTFPADYKFIGSNSSVYRQIGNAVPCNLAKAVAQMAMYLLKCGENKLHPLDKIQQTYQIEMFAS